MRICSFRNDDGPGFGIVEGDAVSDLRSAPGFEFPDLLSALDADAIDEMRDAAGKIRRRLPLDAIEFLPVIPAPRKIICVGLNYEHHRVETGLPKPDHPMLFVRFADTQIGHNADIILPKASDRLDYEVELAVVMGRYTRAVSAEDALRHVAGYSCYNDVSVRDYQMHTSQFTAGKNFPATGPFGPWLVTADEIGDPGNLELTTHLNGRELQRGHTSDLIFSVPRLISYISTVTPLYPGDVIATGTPSGVGYTRNPPIFMADGDVVEVTVEKIGTLRNTVRSEAPED